ncbi:MAG: DUF2358 domain-containing protein [Cyanobacteria bacterium]|nr:DUF2358 domain-containing protein [Cyanobacteriota bacterium]MDW8201624.1 DUF2358 domain-containing protein [Cyanobacteriota bacterium SKYGB_h_bin112]
MTTILDAIKQDYQRFPHHQTYSLYAPDVVFKDPMTQFQGLQRYQQMISWMARWFLDIHLALHEIRQTDDRIETRWTLSWTSPLPWKPRITISGRSELCLNADNLIVSHTDYWDCTRWAVLQQHFPWFAPSA